MAIGTIGGKTGCAAGPVFGMIAMSYSVEWFEFSLDTGPLRSVLGWILLGIAAAIVSGLAVRWITNRVFNVDSQQF